MTDQEVKQAIADLTKKINYHNHLYYIKDKPELSDYEFDLLLEKLITLEKKFPEFRLPESPTRRVGGSITKHFETEIHQYPMLSLGNTYSEEELRDFDARIKKGLDGQTYEYFCELKFDGVSISLIYRDGILEKAITRGDGTRGDNVTTNARTIKTIPLKVNGENQIKDFEVRGEIFLSRKAFEQLNKEREELGEETFANARNSASGTLKMQDSSIVSQRKLSCYAYYLLGEEIKLKTQEECIHKLETWGFNISPTYKKCKDIDAVLSYIKDWETKRHSIPVETDGVVIKINNLDQQNALGFTAKSPRWAIAFKYKPENTSTKLKFITYQVGRTGAITPVAELDPVLLAGTTVKRASLHNANEIARLDLRNGDFVFVEKGGEIIPKVTAVDLSKRKAKSTPLEFIKKCPECGSDLIRAEGEAAFYCPNVNLCPPQVKGKIEHFVHRKAMDINSLGERTISQLFNLGLLKTPADIYDLKKADILKIEGFKEQSTNNLLSGIENSKIMPFESVLFGLGIRHVGKTVAEKLVRHFKNIDMLAQTTENELLQVPEIGGKIAKSIIQFFGEEENKREIFRLKKAGLQFEYSQDKSERKKASNTLNNMTFVVSGIFKNYNREEIKEKIEANGGKVLSGVSGKLDYLVAGENMGPSKREKAEKLGVRIINEEEFRLLLEGKTNKG